MVVALVGVVVALIAAFANPLGISDPGWGWKQAVMLAGGTLLIGAGGATALLSPNTRTGTPPTP
jgi:hypothetical protein